MLPEEEYDFSDEVSKLLLDVMTSIHPPQLPARYAAVESLQSLYAILTALRDFLFAASNGDLSRAVPFKGFVGGTLKALQANLRHLTWQTKMVASGDFSQRVDFMGEFAQSFNAMVVQLDQTLQELVRKEAELSRINEDLRQEIAMRKQTEAALRESEEALRLLAITDSLTGLYNRRHFYTLAEMEINQFLRYGRPLSVMMFDIDFFKRVNDTFGHVAGDLALKLVAETTKRTLRAADIAARYGGEEFIVFLPETLAQEAAVVAERLRQQIENTVILAGTHQLTVTASFGVSDCLRETHAETPDLVLAEFVSTADQALYASKTAGRNRVTVYKPAEAPSQ